MVNKITESGHVQIRPILEGDGKELGFYSKCEEKHLEDLKQDRNRIWIIIFRDKNLSYSKDLCSSPEGSDVFQRLGCPVSIEWRNSKAVVPEAAASL